MNSILETPTNGLRFASTFSGCGGSSLGYRWAGLEGVYANEFNDNAADTYALNLGLEPDRRDVRTVSGDSLMELAGVERGELDLLDGSPPCQPFSTMGRKSEGWGRVKEYAGGVFQRADDLFYEFIRLVSEVQPRAFLAENVSGITKGVAKGYFLNVLGDLRSLDYVVEAKMLDAKWLGVAQSRTRLVIQGVRNDQGARPAWPRPHDRLVTIQDVIPWLQGPYPQGIGLDEVDDELPWLKGRFIKDWYRVDQGRTLPMGLHPWVPHPSFSKAHPLKPCPCIGALEGQIGLASIAHPFEVRKFTILELKRIFGFPDDFQLVGTREDRWARLGNSVVPPMARELGASLSPILL